MLHKLLGKFVKTKPIIKEEQSYRDNCMIFAAASDKLDQVIKQFYHPRPKAVGGLAGGCLDKSLIQVKRLVTAYRLAVSEPKNLGNSAWLMFFYQKHKVTHEVFLMGELESAAAILQNPGSTDMFYGFDNFCHEFIPSILAGIDDYADRVLLRLIWLLEAMGSLRLYNPEGSPPYREIPETIDDILKLIDKKFEKPITFPNPFSGEYGLLTLRGIITPRDTQAIYQAWRMKQLVKDIANPRVLEIGAGLGRTAYYARQLGILDYTIVDIPFTSLSSGHFLIQTLGPENVLLFGEENSTSDINQSAKVFPPTYFLEGEHSFDLILNADSLTEMDPAEARYYLNKIGTSTKIFLSINHELNPCTVQELIEEDTHIRSIDRKPYWMRAGYVEELVHYK